MRRSRFLLLDTVRFARTLLNPRKRLYRYVPPVPTELVVAERRMLDALLPAARGATGEWTERIVVLLASGLREIAPTALDGGGFPEYATRIRAATSSKEAVDAFDAVRAELDQRVQPPVGSAPVHPLSDYEGYISDLLLLDMVERFLSAARHTGHLIPLLTGATLLTAGLMADHIYGAAEAVVCGAHLAGPAGRAALRSAIARASWCGEHEDCRANRELAIACAASRVARGGTR